MNTKEILGYSIYFVTELEVFLFANIRKQLPSFIAFNHNNDNSDNNNDDIDNDDSENDNDDNDNDNSDSDNYNYNNTINFALFESNRIHKLMHFIPILY